MPNSISLTTIVITDPRSTGVAGYFAEFPEVMAQGETKEDLEAKLLSSLADILLYKKNQVLFSKPENQKAETLNFIQA